MEVDAYKSYSGQFAGGQCFTLSHNSRADHSTLNPLCFSGAAALAPPANVNFQSVDYRNILTWTVPTTRPTGESLRYYVQWKM